MTDQVTGSGAPEPSGADWVPGDPVYPDQAPGYLGDLDGLRRCGACGTAWVLSVSGVEVLACPTCAGWRFTPAGSRTGRRAEPLPSWRDLDAEEAEPAWDPLADRRALRAGVLNERWRNYQRWRERWLRGESR